MDVTITREDFDEYIELKHAQERREKARKDIETARQEFVLKQKIDAELMTGIKAGKPWTQFMRETDAPASLRDRYIQLQERSGITPGSVKDPREDQFLKGFQRGGV